MSPFGGRGAVPASGATPRAAPAFGADATNRQKILAGGLFSRELHASREKRAGDVDGRRAPRAGFWAFPPPPQPLVPRLRSAFQVLRSAFLENGKLRPEEPPLRPAAREDGEEEEEEEEEDVYSEESSAEEAEDGDQEGVQRGRRSAGRAEWGDRQRETVFLVLHSEVDGGYEHSLRIVSTHTAESDAVNAARQFYCEKNHMEIEYLDDCVHACWNGNSRRSQYTDTKLLPEKRDADGNLILLGKRRRNFREEKMKVSVKKVLVSRSLRPVERHWNSWRERIVVIHGRVTEDEWWNSGRQSDCNSYNACVEMTADEEEARRIASRRCDEFIFKVLKSYRNVEVIRGDTKYQVWKKDAHGREVLRYEVEMKRVRPSSERVYFTYFKLSDVDYEPGFFDNAQFQRRRDMQLRNGGGSRYVFDSG
eukprot:3145413-Rhodomonas_salina.1